MYGIWHQFVNSTRTLQKRIRVSISYSRMFSSSLCEKDPFLVTGLAKPKKEETAKNLIAKVGRRIKS